MQGGKVCEHLDLITGWPSFGINNLNQTFHLDADQTCTTVKRNFGPFLCTKLFLFSHFGMSGVNRFLEVMKKHHSWLTLGLWLGHSRRCIFFWWSHSVTSMLWVVVPLHHLSSLELQFADGLKFSYKMSWLNSPRQQISPKRCCSLHHI